jgi:hypothetical protein
MASEIELAYFSRSNGVSFILLHDDDLLRGLLVVAGSGIPDLNKGTNHTLPTAPNPADLFEGVENKLKERCYVLQLQGVWIHSDIKEDESKKTSGGFSNLRTIRVVTTRTHRPWFSMVMKTAQHFFTL